MFAARLVMTDLETEIAHLHYCVGDLPGCKGEITHELSPYSSGIVGQLSPTGESPNVLTISAVDAAGNQAIKYLSDLQLDVFPPGQVHISCDRKFARAGQTIHCAIAADNKRYTFLEEMVFMIGSSIGDDDIQTRQSFASLSASPSWVMPKLSLRRKAYVCSFIITCTQEEHSFSCLSVTYDSTAPKAGTIEVTRSTQATFNASSASHETPAGQAASCQVATELIAIRVGGFVEDVSVIEKYFLAVGSWEGGADLVPWNEASLQDGGQATIDLAQRAALGQRLYVSVLVENSVGLRVKVTAAAVVVVPPYSGTITARDGEFQDTTIPSQYSISKYTANWETTDLCATIRQEWAIYREDGVLVQEFRELPGHVRHATASELNLVKRAGYYAVIRMFNSLGQASVARTPGVIVEGEPLLPGYVIDGFKEDAQYQVSVLLVRLETYVAFTLYV